MKGLSIQQVHALNVYHKAIANRKLRATNNHIGPGQFSMYTLHKYVQRSKTATKIANSSILRVRRRVDRLLSRGDEHATKIAGKLLQRLNVA